MIKEVKLQQAAIEVAGNKYTVTHIPTVPRKRIKRQLLVRAILSLHKSLRSLKNAVRYIAEVYVPWFKYGYLKSSWKLFHNK